MHDPPFFPVFLLYFLPPRKQEPFCSSAPVPLLLSSGSLAVYWLLKLKNNSLFQRSQFPDGSPSMFLHLFVEPSASGLFHNLAGKGSVGPLRRGLFSLSPTPSESLNLSLPASRAPFSSIPYAKVHVSSIHTPHQKLTWYFQPDILSLCAVHEPEGSGHFPEKCLLAYFRQTKWRKDGKNGTNYGRNLLRELL